MPDLARTRRFMVDNQVRTFDVTDRALLAVLDELPRERFLPAGLGVLAYSDRAQPCGTTAEGEARLALPPMLIARMIQAAMPVPGERAMVLPAAGGYAAAVLARLTGTVALLESDPGLAAAARTSLAAAGASNVVVVSGPLEAGWAEGGPYEVILVEGGFELRPERLLDQLAEGGRLVGLDASGTVSRAVSFTRAGPGASARRIVDAAGPVLAPFRKPRSFAF